MYDHYIALDWAQRNMAIARLTRSASKSEVIDVEASLDRLRLYLGGLKGSKILTFEETTTSQWLYTELKPEVDEIVVCDPYRNKLLSEGPTTDKIAAVKLVTLLRAGLLKPVFHTSDKFIYFRKIISGYEDVVKAGVRCKNQRSSLLRAVGLTTKKQEDLKTPAEKFVLEGLNKTIEAYETEKARYEEQFEAIYKDHELIRNIESVPGIGVIGAIQIAATVIDPRRFPDKGKFLSYCGLVKLDKISGGNSYGRKRPRYCRRLKHVFDVAAVASITHANSSLHTFYQSLLEKGYAEFNARHALARRIAIITLGIMKTQRRFEPKNV